MIYNEKRQNKFPRPLIKTRIPKFTKYLNLLNKSFYISIIHLPVSFLINLCTIISNILRHYNIINLIIISKNEM